MKKILIGLVSLTTLSAFSYDSRILAKNCASANINEHQLVEVVNFLNEINIKYSINKSSTEDTDYTVTAMGRNGFIKVDLSEGELMFILE